MPPAERQWACEHQRGGGQVRGKGSAVVPTGSVATDLPCGGRREHGRRSQVLHVQPPEESGAKPVGTPPCKRAGRLPRRPQPDCERGDRDAAGQIGVYLRDAEEHRRSAQKSGGEECRVARRQPITEPPPDAPGEQPGEEAERRPRADGSAECHRDREQDAEPRRVRRPRARVANGHVRWNRAVDLCRARVLLVVVAHVEVRVAQHARCDDQVVRFIAGGSQALRVQPPDCKSGAGRHGGGGDGDEHLRHDPGRIIPFAQGGRVQNRRRTPNDGMSGKPAVGFSTMRGVTLPGSWARLVSSSTGLSRFSRLITSMYQDQRPEGPPG